MEKEYFNLIETTLQIKIDECEQRLGSVIAAKTFESISLGEAASLKEFCIKTQSEMDKFFKNDLYHIIGMGNLSAVQLMKFVGLTKKYSLYRSWVKSGAANLNDIYNIPASCEESSYSTKLVPGLTLVVNNETGLAKTVLVDIQNNEQPEISEITEIEETSEIPLIYFRNNNEILIRNTDMDLDQVFKILYPLFGGSCSKFKSAVLEGKNYLGISWLGKEFDEVLGYYIGRAPIATLNKIKYAINN